MSADNSIAEPAILTVAFGSTLAACAPSANSTSVGTFSLSRTVFVIFDFKVFRV